MIEIDSLSHRTLFIDHLSVHPGLTFLVGGNGGGKTTLLRLLSGIDEPESGTISIDGQSPRKVDVGWVNEYPDRSLLFSRVYDEIASTIQFRNTPCDETGKMVKDICGRMGITNLLDRPVHELSGGERALAAIAAALVNEPVLLVLDEYDSHLDPGRCRQIDDIIGTIQSRYVIRCTQQMETAAKGDQVVAIHDGRIVSAGKPAEVFFSLMNTPFYPRSWRKTG
ncbi:MAG: energy-coupling factor ABC transporter ATP-binding protein [Methanoregula sp.]|nr:MAG: energy-coupling factor ABC transporter ATP-binding protein [Methanoregula sp.]